MICTALNYLLVQRWIICTALNDLYYVEWFVQRWMIFYFLEKFVRSWVIYTALKNFDYIEWFGVRWMICTTLNHLGWWIWDDEFLSIRFLISARWSYSKKYCKIFYTKLWVDLFLIWKHQEEIFSALPQKLVIKRCFWSL